jgi:hypothetical protein
MARAPRWRSIQSVEQRSVISRRQTQVYGPLSSDATPLPLVHVIWKGLTIRDFGLPSIVADDAKLAALKEFIGEGLL